MLTQLGNILDSMQAAENAYLRAMQPVLNMDIQCESDGESMRNASMKIQKLPAQLLVAHQFIRSKLTSANSSVHNLQAEFKGVIHELTQESNSVQKGVQQARRYMYQTLNTHEQVANQVKRSYARQKSRSLTPVLSANGLGSVGFDTDPWTTEGKIVEAYLALQEAQRTDRAFLKSAFSKVYASEQKRVQVVKQVMSDFVDAYVNSLTPVHQLALLLKGPIKGMNAEQDLQHLRQSATNSEETAEALSDRQEVAVELVKSEYFCSPEIVRQGRMDWRESQNLSWRPCHFVLTRCGFLHWFDNIENVVPLSVVNLARCTFDDSDSQIIAITEQQGLRVMGRAGMGKLRKFSFRCNNYEETCEWAISIREAIIG
eukprot:TRINITY_DN36987_c0_g1_i6.p1 TRINITY_DN36987_c0_g1~~TRINITY_DN36987_c0_g1_i6.p1  ORF type:complete len:419 (+),score=56.55 TRINITY_DN36987_c0_g1_i6:142-1257(+)